MTPQKRFSVVVALFSAVLLGGLAACGGGDDDSNSQSGHLTDPRSVPTASPWAEAPPVTILDPNALTPEVGETPAPTPEDGGEPGTCGAKYTVASGETFSSIAEKCGFTIQEMRDANPGVDPLTLHPGDEINLPAEPEPSP